jgi:hypothetical protein
MATFAEVKKPKHERLIKVRDLANQFQSIQFTRSNLLRKSSDIATTWLVL